MKISRSYESHEVDKSSFDIPLLLISAQIEGALNWWWQNVNFLEYAECISGTPLKLKCRKICQK